MKKKIIINNVEYIKNVNAFKVSNKWVPQDQLEVDTLTNALALKVKLQPYINLENKIAYSSKLINILLKDKTIPMCESILTTYPRSFISHPVLYDTYILLGIEYNFPSSKFTPKTKIYSVKDSKEVVTPYSELNNNLSFLEKYTFGLEFETSGIPLRCKEAAALGFYELYDGSINGPEYASGILNYKNFHHVEFFLQLLKTISRHDSSCSLHIHVGNIPYSTTNTCAIYSLFQRLQEDLNLLIAPYKKDYKFLYNKNKDHCQNLPLLPDNNFENILSLFKIPNIPSLDTYISEIAKWNLQGRYYTVNFLNYICKNTSSKTIELRSLQMTFNYDYLLTWLIINTAIIDYAVNNTKKVLDRREKIQIEDCLIHFVTDPEVLKNVLNNYNSIKNIIYSKKFIQNDLSTDSMMLESSINNLKPITKSILLNNQNLIEIFYNIDEDKLNAMTIEELNKQHLECLPPIEIRLLGGYRPSKSLSTELMLFLGRAIKIKYKGILDYNTNYILRHEDIKNNCKLYNSEDVNNYCIISKGILYYIVKCNDNTIITSTAIGDIYKSKLYDNRFFETNSFNNGLDNDSDTENDIYNTLPNEEE